MRLGMDAPDALAAKVEARTSAPTAMSVTTRRRAACCLYGYWVPPSNWEDSGGYNGQSSWDVCVCAKDLCVVAARISGKHRVHILWKE